MYLELFLVINYIVMNSPDTRSWGDDGNNGSLYPQAANDDILWVESNVVYFTRQQCLGIIDNKNNELFELKNSNTILHKQIQVLKEMIDEALNDESIFGDDCGVGGL